MMHSRGYEDDQNALDLTWYCIWEVDRHRGGGEGLSVLPVDQYS